MGRNTRKGPVCYRGKLWLTLEQAHLLVICVREAFYGVDTQDKTLSHDFKLLCNKVEGMEKAMQAKARICAKREAQSHSPSPPPDTQPEPNTVVIGK